MAEKMKELADGFFWGEIAHDVIDWAEKIEALSAAAEMGVRTGEPYTRDVVLVMGDYAKAIATVLKSVDHEFRDFMREKVHRLLISLS